MKLFLAALFLSLLAAAARADWQPLGTRWAVERDERGLATQIVDLSYPGYFGHAVIGRIAPPKPQPHPGGAKALSPGIDLSSIPFKQHGPFAHMRSFSLGDVDFARAVRDPARFARLEERWNRELTPGFLEHFHFARQPDGGLEITWRTDSGEDEPGNALQVVELRSLKGNLWRAFARQGLEFTLNEAAGLITIPVLAGLVGTAMDRFFHWSELMISTRQETLAEMLLDPPAGWGLSDAESERAAEALLYAETPLLLTPTWIWLRPRKQWAVRRATESRGSAAARAWLAHEGLDTTEMGLGFDYEPGPGRFFLSGTGLPFGHAAQGPVPGLDPTRPHTIVDRRVFIEATMTAALFGTTWIPYAGGLATDVLKLSIEMPEDNLRRWEMRLAARLESREALLGESWEPQIEELLHQQLNPFEPARVRALELVARRKLAYQRGEPDRS